MRVLVKTVGPYLGVCVLAFLAYGPVLWNGAGFSHPDDVAVSKLECCSFRPLLALTYEFNAKYGGWMLVNLGMHLAAVIMICYLAGPIAGMLFAVHPLAADAVASVSGRSALLLSCCVLLALIVGQRSRFLAAVIGTSAVTAVAGFHWSYFATIKDAPAHMDYLMEYAATIATVFQKLVFPAGLTAEPMIVRDMAVAAVGVVLLGLSVALCFSQRYRIGAGLLILPLLPYALISLPNGFYEHRAYLSIAGMSILAAAALRGIPRVAYLAITALMVISSSRVQVYSSPITLWEDAVRQAPDNGRARLNLGANYAYRDRWNDAQRELEYAVRLIPDTPIAWNNLAMLHFVQGRVGDASRILDAHGDYLKRR